MMHDIVTRGGTRESWKLSDFHVKSMVLSPSNWATCQLPVNLTWKAVKFTDSNARQIPETCGVYTFLVQPSIANHPYCSYLLYVGKAQKNFRRRYRQYLQERRSGDEATRPHVTDMLQKWDGFLWFCYAGISQTDLIETVENALLVAYLPPTNKDFPAKVSAKLRRLFGT